MVDLSVRATEQSNCPVCDTPGKFVFMNTDHEFDPPYVIRIYDCPNCHTSFHNPRMTQAAMHSYYTSGVYRTNPTRAIVEERALERVKETVDLIDKFSYTPPQRCLDVGCSRGYLSRALHEKYGAEVVGYDIYADPRAVIPIVTSKDEIAGKFDLITCIHVLEHLHDPRAELAWMAGMLNEDGMLVIEIPFVKKITLPHPTIFSRESVPMLMKHINARHILLDIIPVDIGIIFAKIGLENGFSLAIRSNV